ncbi:MAG: hypothetical protein DLM52_08445 [Chthoniobacterales bacterium]|nr:MAG: hypothetical protein DLM52_08445 [Chthoniobacterales bacterium]
MAKSWRGERSRFTGREAVTGTPRRPVYVRQGYHRRGYGRAVLADLLRRARELDYHTLRAGCCPEARASIALNESFGFREVARLHEVGRKFDRWLDVTYWQLLL